MREGEILVCATTDGYFPAGECEFDVTISKGTITYSLYLYGKVEDWRSFGKKLTNFPAKITDQVDFEVGSLIANHLSLRATCTGIKVVMTNDGEDPHRCRLEFFIPAEVASINNLGRLLSSWQVENGSEIRWEAQTS